MSCDIQEQVAKITKPGYVVDYDEDTAFVQSLLGRKSMIEDALKRIKRLGPRVKVEIAADNKMLFNNTLDLVEVQKLKTLVDWMSRR